MRRASGGGIAGRAGKAWRAGAVAALALGATAPTALAQLHYTYLWHMEQPIYWPDQAPLSMTGGIDRYETAWISIQRKDGGAFNPQNNLRDIFSLPDRVAGYQFRMRDSIDSIRSRPEAGAQISFSGGLIENLNSLGNANQLGYGPNWTQWIREARGWRTAGNQPRADVVQFGFHHPLMPLIDPAVLRMDLRLYRAVYNSTWGTGATQSRGLFPSEMAFSTRMIEVLDAEGIDWVIVSAEKISRACADFPVVLGSGGVNTDPPNRADQVNPAQGAGAYFRRSISRGCAPAEAAPFALTPRRARYVNPATGAVSSVIVVPASQSLSWEDGYAPLGVGAFNTLASMAPNGLAPNRPMLIMLAHDGDNAWGGGFSYYMEAVPNLAAQAAGAGHVPTVVEQYLADHPVPASDFVHVEDGAWVNADGDFGAPQFINWNWPLLNAQGQIDVENGWHVDARNWAVITAATNRVVTAEQIVTRPGGPQAGGLVPLRIARPDASTTPVERAWHYLLGSLNSGYMYYGSAIDMEVKPAVACNEALQHADPILASNPTLDQTPPTLWTLQRHPWNPGSMNFGPQYGYQQRGSNGDFHVWTFAHDVSGIASATLYYRLDADGQRSLSNVENETYAGGPGVGPWIAVPMTRRAFPAGNVFNDPDINFSEMPAQIADQYFAMVTGVRSKLVDYYVESVDSRGNLARSPIHHVWVGAGTTGGGGGGGGSVVTLAPTQPVAGQALSVTYDPAGRPLAAAPAVFLHWGINNWSQVFTGNPMSLVNGKWTTTITLPTNATSLEMAFNNNAGTWDNNGGQDWRFTVSGGTPTPTWTMDGVRDTASKPIATGNGLSLWAGLIGDTLYVATNDAGEGNDHFIFVAGQPGAMVAAPWAKGGQVAQWSAFLADENNNDFEGWFDQAAGSQAQAATGANGGVLEGTINIRAELGLAPGAPLPEFVFVAMGPYGTNDGAALVSASQLPGAIAPTNGSLEAGEYARVRLCELTTPPSCGPTCDGLDFNQDGDFPTPLDLEDFINAVAGSVCATCSSDLDFNNDGDFPTPLDVEAFISVSAGGPCL